MSGGSPVGVPRRKPGGGPARVVTEAQAAEAFLLLLIINFQVPSHCCILRYHANLVIVCTLNSAKPLSEKKETPHASRHCSFKRI